MNQLESKLAAVSTPNSSNYGEYLDVDVSTANKMLSTNFHTYTDSVGAKKVRTL